MQSFRKPGTFTDRSGKPRKAGFEFEFGNLTVRETARALQRRAGGDIEEKNPFISIIHDSSLGTLRIERDAHLLKSSKYREWLSELNIDFSPQSLAGEIEQEVDRLSSRLIPCEIVTEPLLFDDFSRLDEMLVVLADLEAAGTHESLFYAFGLHINPSMPDLEAATLNAYTQAFLLLSDWIIDDSKTDFSRRFFTKFINPFPAEYREKVLQMSYQPDRAGFLTDYLTDNPTRNRPLDVLPVLYEIDSETVLNRVREEEKPLLSGRPALHYRLADCRVGDPAWSVAQEWNRWWYVEMLAADSDGREQLIRKWREHEMELSLAPKTQWINSVDHFLKEYFQTE